jgi:hypothetical protein
MRGNAGPQQDRQLGSYNGRSPAPPGRTANHRLFKACQIEEPSISPRLEDYLRKQDKIACFTP